MYFNSITFLLFFLIFYAAYHCAPGRREKIFLIVAGSYVFYGFWSLPFVLLLLLSTTIDYFASLHIEKTPVQSRKKIFLILALSTNLGILFFFKYFNFFTETAHNLLHYLGFPAQTSLSRIVLPAGISFYTFQTLSYTIDVYRGQIRAEKSFMRYAAYVSFFPQLVAGPILRAGQFLPQLCRKRTFSWNLFYLGFCLVTWGIFKKSVLADNLALYVERIYDYGLPCTTLNAWIATYAYTMQIFFDFSGYSDTAIGLALLLGFNLPRNFNCPYAACSFSDFWRRWHISLSTWLKDYLYIPLGGNRKNRNRTYINLMITMLLGGLWHGASWNFVLWGGVHGLLLAGSRAAGFSKTSSQSPIRTVFKQILVFHVICLTWVLFRAPFSRALEIYSALIPVRRDGAAIDMIGSTASFVILALLVITLVCQKFFANQTFASWISEKKFSSVTAYVLIVSLMWIAVFSWGNNAEPFIYFQF